jgi:hypothetical protein
VAEVVTGEVTFILITVATYDRNVHHGRDAIMGLLDRTIAKPSPKTTFVR